MSTGPATGPSGHFGRVEIVAAARQVLIDGRPAPLGSRAFDLLSALVARRDRVVSKDELLDVVWPGLVVEENNLQVQISALRKLLGPQAIATVPGRGYQFTVAATDAPVSPDRTLGPATGASLASGPVPGQPARLLVADDNKVNRLLLCRSLALMGHRVDSVDNGRLALDALRAGRADLLLLDLEMPELDGFSLLEQRAREPALQSIPVIVTSSVEGAAAVARCIELGADDYLHKPVNPMLLKARVEASLERKRLRDQQRDLLARLAPDMALGDPISGADLPGRRVVATLMSAQVVDVDAGGEQISADALLELLSHWATLMLDAIEGQGGVVTGLFGDGLTASFGARHPESSAGGSPAAALRCAREMVDLLMMFNAERAAAGQGPLTMAAGLATGEVVAGYAGSSRRTAFVCVGATVRRARCLQALAAERGDAVLLDDATVAALAGPAHEGHFEGLQPVIMPGNSAPQKVHRLLPCG
jgi:DNA-binding response OmpR family regulator